MTKLADDPEVADEVIGFHAQQAVEKLLKAILINADTDPERTHNLSRLMRAVKDAGFNLPDMLTSLDTLTPYAVELRYGFFPNDIETSLDRHTICGTVRQLREWTEGHIKR